MEDNIFPEITEGKLPELISTGVYRMESVLPRDASRHFSRALVGLAGHLAADDPFPDARDPSIPGELRRSLMVLRGRLVPPWDERLAEPLAQHGGERQGSQSAGDEPDARREMA